MKLLLIILLVFISVLFLYTLQKNKNQEVTFKQPLPASLPLAPNEFTVVAAGDIACESLTPTDYTCQQQETANLIKEINPQFVLTLGDLQYDSGTYENFINFYDKSWGAFKDKTKPVIGNHEYAVRNASGYFDYFNGQDQFSGVAGDRDKGYYSFEKDNWKFYVLNSNCWAVGGCEISSPQGKWLERELTNNPISCQLAAFHHPLFSSGRHGPSDETKPLWQLLYRHDVDLVLSGHDHLYERFGPLDPDGKIDNQKGISEFIVGTGGKEFYKVNKILPGSIVRIEEKFGVLKLDLKQSSFNWQFITVNNGILDSGSANCHTS